jgi:hypothetical protein
MNKELNDFFEKNFWNFDEKENKVKDNKYDNCLEGTCNLNSNNNDLIIELYEKNKIIGRKFLKNKDEVGYYEIFEDSKLNLLNHVSKNITFLYSSKNIKNTEEYELNENIGFRFYDDRINVSASFFTLFRRYDNRFYILEVEEIKKNPEKYLKIIKKIIYQKYLDGNFPDGESIIEILGYCYILMNINFENIVFMEPYIPIINNPDSLRDPSPKEFINDITYIIPIIYCKHISICLTGKFINPNTKKPERCNIFIDMSKVHSLDNKLDKFLFPPSFNENLKVFPTREIQKYPSCGLWFLGETELIFNTKGNVFLKIFHKLRDKSFTLEVTNQINKNIGLKSNVIEIIERNDDKIDVNKIIYTFLGIDYKIDKDIILNYVLDLGLLFSLDGININQKEINFIIDSQEIIEEARNLITNLNSNKNYMKIVGKNIEDQELNKYDKAKNVVKHFIETFFKKYSISFLAIHKQLLIYDHFSNQNYLEIIKKYFKGIENSEINYKIINEAQEELKNIKKEIISLIRYDEKTINDIIDKKEEIFLRKLCD